MQTVKEIMIQMLEQEIEKNKVWFDIEASKKPPNQKEIDLILDRIESLKKQVEILKRS
jgi:hypothetical protein